MGEKVDKRIHRTLQKSSNLYSVWYREETSRTTLLSANSNNNSIGCSSPTLDDLYNENRDIYRQNYENGYECVGSSNNGKCNGINERREDCEIYIQGISSRWNSDRNNNERNTVQEQQINSNIEETALNRCVGWQYMNERKAENTVSFCGEKQDVKGRNNLLMIVKMIANKSDRKRVAKFLNCYIESEDPTTYKCYLKDVKAYGFDHIILIGECYAGILFLDCYRRVFEWEDSMSVLWSLGDNLSMAEKKSLTRRVIWGEEYDRTVTKFENAMDNLPNEPTFDKSATKTMDVYLI
ncbi:10892_t:CDS:2 [Funneliformis geosporum]|uniref:10892_t:CDS:1 n=1 Tax=Funneliformis geosporum TaxID=1117311 RepID=A0A9W4WYQ9_9GLOM|nr:10892_t:CDS:2 [Funneliformis geosporum]